jgi:uncharacterized BrkB/YihY/UPF0761 family membrane protein
MESGEEMSFPYGFKDDGEFWRSYGKMFLWIVGITGALILLWYLGVALKHAWAAPIQLSPLEQHYIWWGLILLLMPTLLVSPISGLLKDANFRFVEGCDKHPTRNQE